MTKRDEIEVVVIEPDASVARLTVDPTLENMRGLIGGGWLEGIGGPDWVAYLDEEGKLNKQELNIRATRLATAAGWSGSGHDVLVGTVVFLGPPDKDGDDTSVTDSIIRHLD